MQALTATSIALSVLAAANLANVEVNRTALRQTVGKAQGKQLDVLATATDNYSIANFLVLTSGSGQIVKADGSAGTVATPLAPTVTELANLGYLQSNFNATNYFGGAYKVSLAKLPNGCSYPNCSIGGTVSLTNAVMKSSSGVVDGTILGAAVQQIGADGGYSTPGAIGTIVGLNGGWNTANPAGSVAGILAERVGQGSQRFTAFLRRDGTLPMTGPLSLIEAVEGSPCSGNGVAQNGVGVGMLFCKNGIWRGQRARTVMTSAAVGTGFHPLGHYSVCTGAGISFNTGSTNYLYTAITPTSSPDADMQSDWMLYISEASNSVPIYYTCFSW